MLKRLRSLWCCKTQSDDFIEISGGNLEKSTTHQHTSKSKSTEAREAYFLDYAAAIKAALTIPLMATGGFQSASVINDVVESGKFI